MNIAPIMGMEIKTTGLHINAAFMSPFKAKMIKCVVPHPGHLYPVNSLKAQGT